MQTQPLWPYKSPLSHESISEIIRRHSSNRTDVRAAALDHLSLATVTTVLDLGCGFGFMAEALAPRVALGALVYGIDAWEENEDPFLARVTASGRRARFRHMELESTLPFADHSFDLVVCCYSLYYFIDLLPEVTRVLRPDGVFLALTHSEKHVAGELPAAGLAEAAASMVSLVRKFSSENGLERLEPLFAIVERIEYRNSLTFKAAHLDELMAYLRFKLPLLLPGAQPSDGIPEPLERYVRETMACAGEVVVQKDDAIFRARRPRCR